MEAVIALVLDDGAEVGGPYPLVAIEWLTRITTINNWGKQTLSLKKKHFLAIIMSKKTCIIISSATI